MKRVIRQANQYPRDKHSFSTMRWRNYSELLCTVEKGAYRLICSSNCSSRLSSKSLTPFQVSNACGPFSSKVILNTHLGTYSIKEQRSVLKMRGEEVILSCYSNAEYQTKEWHFSEIFFYLYIDILVFQDVHFVQEKALWSSESLFHWFKGSHKSWIIKKKGGRREEEQQCNGSLPYPNHLMLYGMNIYPSSH